METGTHVLEVELKLDAEPADLDALVRAPCLSGATFVASEQVSTYHDSGDRALYAAGLSLRVRRIGDRRVQTVKAESEAAAGLFARTEWERTLDGDDPVLDAAASPVATLVGSRSTGGGCSRTRSTRSSIFPRERQSTPRRCSRRDRQLHLDLDGQRLGQHPGDLSAGPRTGPSLAEIVAG